MATLIGEKREASKGIASVERRIAELQTLLAELKSDYERRFGTQYKPPKKPVIKRQCEHIDHWLGGIGGFSDAVVKCPKCGKLTRVCGIGHTDFKKFQQGKDTLDYLGKENIIMLETGLCRDCQRK